MSASDFPVGRARLREIVRWLGRGYLGYHILTASVMIFWFFVDSRPGYWREPGALSELAFDDLPVPAGYSRARHVWRAAQLWRKSFDNIVSAGFSAYPDCCGQRNSSGVQFYQASV